MSGVIETRTGIAGQFGFATEDETALNTIVSPDTFLPIISASGGDDTTVLRSQGMTGGVVLGSTKRRELFHGSTKELTFDWLTKGFPKLVYHCLGGYSIEWPGSTNGTATLTLNSNPIEDDTVTIGTQTYTFKDELTSSSAEDEVLIGDDTAETVENLIAAINRGFRDDGQGPGEIYGSDTRRNTEVIASEDEGDVVVTDRQARGAAVNSGEDDEVATTESFDDVDSGFDNSTLTGGVDGTDSERVHTFTFDPQAMLDLAMSAQIVIPPSEAGRQAFTYGGGKCTQVAISCETGGQLQIVPSVHFRSRTLNEAIAAASYASAATFFDFTEIDVEIDDESTTVTGVSLTIPLNLATERMRLGSAEPRNQLGPTAWVEMTGQLSKEFENVDLYQAWLNGDVAKITATATGDTIPDSSNPYKVVLELPAVQYTGETPNLGGTEIQTQNAPFEVLKDDESEPVTIKIHSDDLWAGGAAA